MAAGGWPAWLLVVLTALVLQILGAAHAAAPTARSMPTGLSAQGAWNQTTPDPVRALAIDIAEHLPATASSVGAPPLPLHDPAPPLHGLSLDELQGLEWAGLWPFGGRCLPASQRATPAACDRFASTDPRRDERPPTAPDRQQP